MYLYNVKIQFYTLGCFFLLCMCIYLTMCCFCSWADAAANLNHISASFDQEAAAVVMSRMAVARYVHALLVTLP